MTGLPRLAAPVTSTMHAIGVGASVKSRMKTAEAMMEFVVPVEYEDAAPGEAQSGPLEPRIAVPGILLARKSIIAISAGRHWQDSIAG
jgi:hypothetical protein